MNTQLPAYLQGKPVREEKLVEAASAGIGSSQPPHVSIQGNTFTLKDASGAENSIGATMDVCIVDVSKVTAKRFYGGKEWTPDANDPPVCWSSNGIGPSIEATSPQARTCAECPNNVRGSAVSKISGASIKACRDEKLLALLLPQFPQMLFQLVVTPGSFTNFRDYLAKFNNQPFDIDDVLTRIAFQPKVNGVLTFTGIAHLEDAAVLGARNQALIEKKTDLLVGRLDRPRTGALPNPTQGQAALPAPNAASPSTATAPAPTPTANPAPGVFPSNGQGAPAAAEAPRRRGRPKAETAAAPTAAAPEPATAPFRPAAAPAFGGQPAAAFGASGGASGGEPAAGGFGIQPGVAPNPELEKSLSDVFGPK